MRKGSGNFNNKYNQDLVDVAVSVRRVTKVITGGSRLSFSVLVVVGDKRGKVGYGSAKDRELGEAKNKALKIAKRSMFHVPLRSGKTLHHDIKGSFGSAKVVLRSARSGTGVIAGASMRSIFECLGLQDVTAKSLGSSNPYNLVRATMAALKSISTPKQLAERRGMRVSFLLSRRKNIG